MSFTINDLPRAEITEKVTGKTVEFAERFGNYLGIDERGTDSRSGCPVTLKTKLTTNQLRKFFGEVKRQQMRSYDETQFVLLKPKLAYAVGRADKKSKISDFYAFMSGAIDAVHDEKTFKNFIMVFEAIVAYHKAAENK